MNDVCLILEGTYPYVAGGVSVCVYDLIRNLPHLNFSIIHLAASGDSVKELKYPIPNNIKEFHEIFLFDFNFSDEMTSQKIDPHLWDRVIEFHRCARRGDVSLFSEMYETFFNPRTKKVEIGDLLYRKEVWNILIQLYQEGGLKTDFSDFFWNFRFIYFPIFKILSSPIPKARLYHSMCTGYAGLYAVAAKLLYQKPYLLTEHGIYTEERKIDISEAQWIPTLISESDVKAQKNPGFFKQWWISTFQFLGSLSYAHADHISTIYDGNRIKQIQGGADPEKISIISNGIEVERFSHVTEDQCPKKKNPQCFRIGFIGRVVPIKDVKTFLRSIKIVQEHVSNIEVLIMGPTEEDEEYYEECVLLTELLGLDTVIEFLGRVSSENYYSTLDVLVLTSISEGQPLVVLEAGACGVPVVATEVGANRELLYGRSHEDQVLGRSGIVTSLASPHETAEAIIKILKDTELKKYLGEVAKKRVSRFYQQEDILDQYHLMYRKYL